MVPCFSSLESVWAGSYIILILHMLRSIGDIHQCYVAAHTKTCLVQPLKQAINEPKRFIIINFHSFTFPFNLIDKYI